MNEEIEYAEMLEIPVSTVNLVRKKKSKKSKPLSDTQADLKKSIITRVNERLCKTQDEPLNDEQPTFTECETGAEKLVLDGVPERIDTVRLYSDEDRSLLEKEFSASTDEGYFTSDNFENDGGRYKTKPISHKEKRIKTLLNAEFAAACVLCGTIFMTNVFMPNSAINTFFRNLTLGSQAAATDTRTYNDFTLSPIISERANAELSLSETGVLSLLGECCIYPSADGTVSELIHNADGTYTVKIGYSNSFTGVISGLTSVFYEVGDSVKANVPIAYTSGETAVEVTRYDGGELLNCFELTEENCLAWLQD